MTPWKDTRLSREEQFRMKREAVLREAALAFRRQGFHNTSLDDVASALHVTKAAVYYYFKSKHEILYEAHKLSMDLGDQAFEKARREGRNGREKIAITLNEYIRSLTGELGAAAVLVEVNALPEPQRTEIVARRDKFDHDFRALVEEGVRDGSIRDVDPKLAVFFFMGAVNWLTRWYVDDGGFTGKEIADTFVDLMMNGLRRSRR